MRGVCVLVEMMILQVSRNPQTGESRGSGYVTMGSINSAKTAIASLDGTVRAQETKTLLLSFCVTELKADCFGFLV